MEIIITAANANYFELLQGTILSIREKPQGRNAIVGFFDLGCTPEQIQWLQERVNIIKQPDWEFNFPSIDEAPTHLKGLLARPFLRKYFSNFDIYLWIDADAWVQDWKAVDLFVEAAKRGGLAIVPEIDRGSEIQYGGLRKFWWQWVYHKYQEAFGEEVAENFYSYPVLNAGVFALHKDAPHWEVWAEYLERGLQQSVSLMTDQFALNLSVYQGGLFDETEMLPAWCNWTYHHAFPSWDKEKSCFVEPYLPHTPIGILHLSGPDKEKQIQLKTTDRDVIELSLLYTAKLESSFVEQNGSLPVGDYVSPGFKVIQPDSCFPNMIIGDTSGCPWPYLRREIPHNWYADKRYPLIGFVSRDEAHILYNTALKFKGKKALEIGCWMGWSACHLALGGVELDVIDPILEKPELYESVSNSLQAAGVLDSVRLIPGYSPEKVEEVAADGRKWSLIFIDGNHDAPGPLNDAIICETLAEPDALILFHDLASPDVAQGLDYLKERGWNTMIYQTMQIMGVAWRGNVEPVIHQGDPKIEWHLPEHLQHHPVSGTNKPPISKQDFSVDILLKLVDKVESGVRQLNITEEIDVKQALEFNQQGREFFIQGYFNRALVAFKNAGKLNPSSGIANKFLSQLYWQSGDFAASLKHYLLAKSGHGVLSDRETKEFQNIVAAIRPYTLLSEARLFSLYTLARQICLDDIPGNFVECGTCKGGSAALLAFAIKRYSLRPRLLYAFDTFEGMPDPTDVDKHQGIPANDTGLGVGTLKAPIIEGLDVVCQALDVGDIVVPVQGLFASTLPESKSKMGNIALLHADGDWYESTMDIFNNLFVQVVDDGVIQIDDYGFWEGCRKAIHDFERSQNLSFPLRRIDDTGVWFRKAEATVAGGDRWHNIWYLAEVAEKIGDPVLAAKLARATLKLLPGLVTAEAMLARLVKIPELNLRAINLIIFPDWTQPEELLLEELDNIIRVLLTHPERERITLLVETSNISQESADLAISDVVMNILYEQELNVDESPEISFVSQLNQIEWEALRPHIHSRIIMNNENRIAIAASALAAVPSCEIASFANR